MKKIVISLLLVCILLSLYFIPVTIQKSTSVKASFFNAYSQLTHPDNWKKWRPDLHAIFIVDSSKITVNKTTNSFSINTPEKQLTVKLAGSLISVDEKHGDKTTGYAYFVMPDNTPDKTQVTAYKSVNLLMFIVNKLKPVSFEDTYLDDFKHFMETDSLFYGYNIVKSQVPGDKLAVVVKTVLAKNKLAEANKALSEIRQYIKSKNVKQVAWLIDQFLLKNKDSLQMKVGVFIDKEITPYKDITLERMPKGANLIVAKYKGPYNQKWRVSQSIQKYFADHTLQQGILPFDSFPDNKLPLNDTDKVNMQVNFATLF